MEPKGKGGAIKVRQSKYRHVFGTPFQSTECIMGLKIGASQPESTVLKANAKFFSLSWAVSGCVAVFPTNSKGAIMTDPPLIVHEENSVNDIAFNPFDDSLLATATNDGSVYLWNIPEGGLTSNLTQPTHKFAASDKRLLYLDFHPLASNVLLTADAGKTIKLFDLETSQEKLTFPDSHKAQITNASWNGDGSLVATSCKDKTLRVFDPRANKVVQEAADHQGTKGGRVQWLGRKDLVFTVGFGKGSERQYALYDTKKNLQRLVLETIDNSASTILPFYDDDLGLIYLAGKGDSTIRIYEVENDQYVFHLTDYKSKNPQSGIAYLPKSSCDVMKCEILRALQLTPSGSVIPIRFEVPRKENVFFQDDIFPDTFDGKPSMTSDEWFSGTNNPPKFVSLNPEKK